jgi:beta-aspartyl-peptidase (threonine type)
MINVVRLLEMKRLRSIIIRMPAPLLTRLTVSIILVTLCETASKARSAENDPPERAIRRVLEGQVEAWNRGDIAGFMNGYARSDKTTFVSGDEIRHGWKTVLQRYRARYPDKAAMGRLSFTEIDVQTLSADAAVAKGRFRLQRAHDTPHGRFTLILRRLPEGWRIVHDHTSSAEK